jgi:hypothetical protein
MKEDSEDNEWMMVATGFTAANVAHHGKAKERA